MYVCAREGLGEVCTYVLGRVWEYLVCRVRGTVCASIFTWFLRVRGHL